MITDTPCEHLSSGSFSSRLAPDGQPRPAYWFIFQGDLMWAAELAQGGEGPESTRRAAPPQIADAAELGFTPERQLYLGLLTEGEGAADCYAAEAPANAAPPPGMFAEGLRALFPLMGEAFWGVAGRAVQLLAWDRTTQFCGQCGGRNEHEPHERAKRCPRCGLVTYPRLSPAIIIAVVREDAGRRELLLARNHRFPTGRYSVLAGYVEPGETLEECAHREVCEEVGIAIRNMRYFGSQPWPFPNSLMIAFTADYAGGALRLEASEIAEAGWFPADALPGIPPKMSIARRLIEWFRSTSGGDGMPR